MRKKRESCQPTTSDSVNIMILTAKLFLNFFFASLSTFFLFCYCWSEKGKRNVKNVYILFKKATIYRDSIRKH